MSGDHGVNCNYSYITHIAAVHDVHMLENVELTSSFCFRIVSHPTKPLHPIKEIAISIIFRENEEAFVNKLNY